VKGKYVDHLHHTGRKSCLKRESNTRPPDLQSGALPTELLGLITSYARLPIRPLSESQLNEGEGDQGTDEADLLLVNNEMQDANSAAGEEDPVAADLEARNAGIAGDAMANSLDVCVFDGANNQLAQYVVAFVGSCELVLRLGKMDSGRQNPYRAVEALLDMEKKHFKISLTPVSMTYEPSLGSQLGSIPRT
jgi:hypothetical protein